MTEGDLKTYYGVPTTPTARAMVTIRTKGGTPVPLAHHFRHSPEGFSWGYPGSESSELARCLLVDAFGIMGCPDYPKLCNCLDDSISQWVEPNYHKFTDEVIAKLPQSEDWKMNQVEIANWVFDHMAGSKEDIEAVPVPL